MKKMIKTGFALIICASLVGKASASLILTINDTTTDQISLSISGTLDSDTIGLGDGNPGFIAIKKDWSSNNGTHTEWVSGTPTVSLNSIQIGGASVVATLRVGTGAHHDSVFFTNPLGGEQTISAGTVVSGNLVLSGIGMFIPSDSPSLELLSGWNGFDYARHEAFATVVPEPSSIILMGVAGGFAVFIRRRFRR